jgi:hypothetical protein
MESKYPFVKFSDNLQDNCCCVVLPVSNGIDIAFYQSISDSGSFNVVDLAGNLVGGPYSFSDGYIDFSSINLDESIAVYDCFRIEIGGYYSNVFMFIGCETDNTHHFEYWDDGEYHQRVRLRCSVGSPQSKTEKEEYIDSNGTVQPLSKTRRKEYTLTTDFYSEAVHDAIKEMLTYPFLQVDGVFMYESGDYAVNWDEQDESGNAMSETTLSEQDILRYSICN